MLQAVPEPEWEADYQTTESGWLAVGEWAIRFSDEDPGDGEGVRFADLAEKARAIFLLQIGVPAPFDSPMCDLIAWEAVADTCSAPSSASRTRSGSWPKPRRRGRRGRHAGRPPQQARCSRERDSDGIEARGDDPDQRHRPAEGRRRDLVRDGEPNAGNEFYGKIRTSGTARPSRSGRSSRTRSTSACGRG
jgi:hypothetical protein